MEHRSKLKRFPRPSKESLDNLPSEAKTILDFAEGKLDNRTFRELQMQFVDVMNNSSPDSKPVSSEKTSYGGALQMYTMNIVNEIGAYNPSSIPTIIYEKMSKDPTLALGLSVIKNVPAGLNWRIKSDNEEQRALLTEIIKPIYRSTTVNICDAVRYGFAVGEKIWDWKEMHVHSDIPSSKKKKVVFQDNAWVISKIKFIHPRTVRMKLDKKGNFNGIIQEIFNGPYFRTQIKPNKVVLYSHNVEFGNFFGQSRLDNCYPSWYWSQVLTQFALKYYERRGQPLVKVRAPAGSRTDKATGKVIDNLDRGLKIGQAAIGNSVIAIPSEFDKQSGKDLWDVTLVTDDQRGDMFISILNFMDSRKLRGLFFPDKMGLAADGAPHAGGGGAAGDALDIFVMVEQALINDLEEVFNTQIIPQILEYNFAAKDIEPAVINIEKIEYNRKMLMKDVILRMIMLSGSMVRDGKLPKFMPSISKLAEMLDIPVEEFDESFKNVPIPGTTPITKPVGVNVAKSPTPTVEKKKIQDKNNDRVAKPDRKIRPSKERSIREKKK